MTSNPINTLLPVPSGILEVPHDFFTDASVGENTNHSPLRLSLILPTYNESPNIEPIVKRLTLLLDSTIPEEYELIVVDDNSPDETWKVATEIMPNYPQLRVAADLQHPPETVIMSRTQERNFIVISGSL